MHQVVHRHDPGERAVGGDHRQAAHAPRAHRADRFDHVAVLGDRLQRIGERITRGDRRRVQPGRDDRDDVHLRASSPALACAAALLAGAIAALPHPAVARDALPDSAVRAASLVAGAGDALAARSATTASPRPEAPRAVARIEGVVERVYDGDSFRMRTADGRELGVRIAGIDAPERTQPFANVSRRALHDAIGNRDVRIEAVKVDPYGRVVARVFVGGRDIGLEQIDQGLAWHFARYDADLAPAERERYARAQAAARERRVGLWQQNDPLAPWLFRKERR